MFPLAIGQIVLATSKGQNRTILAIAGDHALCRCYITDEENWLPVSSLKHSLGVAAG